MNCGTLFHGQNGKHTSGLEVVEFTAGFANSNTGGRQLWPVASGGIEEYNIHVDYVLRVIGSSIMGAKKVK